MALYETALRRRESVAEGTAAFFFEKPAGFAHQAGQNAVFTLVDPPDTDSQGPSRTFTIGFIRPDMLERYLTDLKVRSITAPDRRA